jgi:hypothetical protein
MDILGIEGVRENLFQSLCPVLKVPSFEMRELLGDGTRTVTGDQGELGDQGLELVKKIPEQVECPPVKGGPLLWGDALQEVLCEFHISLDELRESCLNPFGGTVPLEFARQVAYLTDCPDRVYVWVIQ